MYMYMYVDMHYQCDFIMYQADFTKQWAKWVSLPKIRFLAKSTYTDSTQMLLWAAYSLFIRILYIRY